jgi:hypothetical protein
MRIAIDIDGTIATGNTVHFFELCNRYFDLSVSVERLQSLDWAGFYALPEVVACQNKRGKQQFKRALQWLGFTAPALRGMDLIEGARDGVERLTQQGQIAYYTARLAVYDGQNLKRIEAVQKLNERMAEATSEWLALHGFPCPDQVVCCDGPAGKLLKLADFIQETNEPCILIDDLYTELLSVELDEDKMNVLRSNLTLIAYTAKEPPTSPWLNTIPFPHWECIGTLEKEILYANQHHASVQRQR